MATKIVRKKRVEGDINFDGELIFKDNTIVVGSIKARRINIEKSLEVGGSLEVGEYLNLSFSILDLNKIKPKIIRFTPTYYHERNFWLQIFNSIEGVDDLKSAISSSCWEDILPKARLNKDKLLAYEHYLPAVRQAIEHMTREI